MDCMLDVGNRRVALLIPFHRHLTLLDMSKHQNETSDHQGSSKKQKKTHQLPTQDEQRQLQQMEVLLKNNLLNLQAKELVDEMTSINQKKYGSKRLGEWLSQLETDLTNTSTKSGCHGREISLSFVRKQNYEGIGNWIGLDEVDEDNFSITFEAPVKVETVGSFLNQSSTSPYFNIDILVTMPASMFDSRDILNNIYFNKRALYLAGIRKTLLHANKLKKDQTDFYKNMKTMLFKADPRKPILQLQPYYSDSLFIRIIPVVSLIMLQSGETFKSTNSNCLDFLSCWMNQSRWCNYEIPRITFVHIPGKMLYMRKKVNG
jgi:hypothetical protein